jgi:SAM-dependent methyltransferase
LELGCGDGWLLEALRQAGWDVVGIERSEKAALRATRLGLDVQVGDWVGCGFPAASFDLVILWHVLEHLHDPLATLAEVHRVMRSSGRLVIAVPNVDSWQAKVAGRRWVHLDVPRHLYHFDPTTLESLLARAGFQAQVWSWFSPVYELRGWWEAVAAHAESRAVSRSLQALTIPCALALSIVSAHRKASAAMTVQAHHASLD